MRTGRFSQCPFRDEFNYLFLHTYLVGGLDHFLFVYILGKIIPTDFHIFSEGLKPTTRSIIPYGSKIGTLLGSGTGR